MCINVDMFMDLFLYIFFLATDKGVEHLFMFLYTVFFWWGYRERRPFYSFTKKAE